MALRAGCIHLVAGIGDIGPGRADVLVVGVGDARAVALGASDALELMGPGQLLLHEGQVTDQAGGVGAQDVGGILVVRRLTRSADGDGGRSAVRASPRSRPAPRPATSDQQRRPDAQTVSQWRSHW